MRFLLVGALIALAACAQSLRNPVADPDRYVTTDAPIPFAVRQLLPSGVLPSDVRVWENCYGFVAGGTVYPVLNPAGTQYCI
ncbi:hypothetical protein JANAI62_11640 [Jannaschia pagri]|uniref:Lipoprotein n=1 Tax=Jannaschia pagri TaxID=2829797 RepID=A0ABQ4NJG5_9RHOB|nr:MULTISPECIES: hypothetical protein [unclassified Jannaschia]GIT90709.1 hypothetical protein JANAI61_11670 [Jannaschia sp. AI_61]GIT94541.1 hypothetical protein JANAI62_11640 [Jannaschia sp. AI_62]